MSTPPLTSHIKIALAFFALIQRRNKDADKLLRCGLRKRRQGKKLEVIESKGAAWQNSKQ